LSRSLGDYTGHRIGATSEPGLGFEPISKHNEYLVIASKGLWNFMTPKEVFDFIKTNSNFGLGTVSNMLAYKVKEISLERDQGPLHDITIVIQYFNNTIAKFK
jgi:serine/threonine protein phosphatase PrpC